MLHCLVRRVKFGGGVRVYGLRIRGERDDGEIQDYWDYGVRALHGVAVRGRDYGLRDKGKEDMSGKLSIRPFPNLHL